MECYDWIPTERHGLFPYHGVDSSRNYIHEFALETGMLAPECTFSANTLLFLLCFPYGCGH